MIATIWLLLYSPLQGTNDCRGLTCLAEAQQTEDVLPSRVPCLAGGVGARATPPTAKTGSTCPPTGHLCSPLFCEKEQIYGEGEGICLGSSLWVPGSFWALEQKMCIWRVYPTTSGPRLMTPK